MKKHRLNRSRRLVVEPLEARETPATFVNATTITYQDLDGDNVTVKLSKPILTAAIAAQVFAFNNAFATAGQQQLRSINFGALDVAAPGLGVATTAVRSAANGGDGFAAVGQIVTLSGNSFLKFDLGAVVIDGDLGRIDAGDNTTATPGLASLTVHSMGRFGTTTGASNLFTNIIGKLGALTVKTDIKEAFIDVEGGDDGDIGSVTIGGSLIGGTATNSGSVKATGEIGIVTIRGSVLGGGSNSGEVFANRIGRVTIGGDLIGGAGTSSGRLFSNETLGAVKISGDVIGGSGVDSGEVVAVVEMGSVSVGGDLIGGVGQGSGQIASGSKMGAVKVAGNLVGGGSSFSGEIASGGTLASVTLGGNQIGGGGFRSGLIFSGEAMGAVKITGDVIGGAGDESGLIFTSSTLASATIGGDLIGGDGQGSGRIESVGAMGPIKVTGNVVGGGGDNSAWIFTDSSMTSVSIGGNLTGGAGDKSGQIDAGGAIGTIKITGNFVGGSATGTANLQQSGYIQGQRIGTLTIGGSLIAGTTSTTGTYFDNGAIRAADDIGTLTIGNIIGNGTNFAIISARGSAAPTATSDVAIGKLTVKGRVELARILGGFDLNRVAVNADAQIGAVTVGGDWIASSIAAGAVTGNAFFGDTGDAKISGAGVKDVDTVLSKIGSLIIAGQAVGSLSGGDHFGIIAENVGIVKVGGTLLPTSAATLNEEFPIGITNDFKVNEI